jgi:hypothetical protein
MNVVPFERLLQQHRRRPHHVRAYKAGTRCSQLNFHFRTSISAGLMGGGGCDSTSSSCRTVAEQDCSKVWDRQLPCMP